MNCSVVLSKEVIKELDRLDTKIGLRIQKRFDELATNPYDARISEKVITIPGQRYSRVGDRRIFFVINDYAKTLDIIAIRPRGRAYPKGK